MYSDLLTADDYFGATPAKSAAVGKTGLLFKTDNLSLAKLSENKKKNLHEFAFCATIHLYVDLGDKKGKIPGRVRRRLGCADALKGVRLEYMFKSGDYVHHATHGLCRVEDVTQLDVPGATRQKLYYHLMPVEGSQGSVFTPVEQTKVVIRSVMNAEEAEGLIGDIPAIDTLWIGEEKKREQSYKEALKSMECREWVRIIKTLYLRRLDREARGRKVTSTDEKYLRIAEDWLYGELSVALGVPKDEMEEYISNRLGSSTEETN